MPYKKDGFLKSFLRGRIGAVATSMIVAGLAGAGYVISPEDAKSLEALVTGLLAGVAAALSMWSKIRETRQLKLTHPDDFEKEAQR